MVKHRRTSSSKSLVLTNSQGNAVLLFRDTLLVLRALPYPPPISPPLDRHTWERGNEAREGAVTRQSGPKNNLFRPCFVWVMGILQPFAVS